MPDELKKEKEKETMRKRQSGQSESQLLASESQSLSESEVEPEFGAEPEKGHSSNAVRTSATQSASESAEGASCFFIGVVRR